MEIKTQIQSLKCIQFTIKADTEMCQLHFQHYRTHWGCFVILWPCAMPQTRFKGVLLDALTRAETVKSLACIFSVSQSTFLLVLMKMTACVMVSVSYRSHSVSSFHSWGPPQRVWFKICFVRTQPCFMVCSMHSNICIPDECKIYCKAMHFNDHVHKWKFKFYYHLYV